MTPPRKKPAEEDEAAPERRISGLALGTEFGPPMAALDLGTNNCRLLIADQTSEGFEVIDAFSRAVRLGEGLEQSGRLSTEAQARAIKALRICAAKLRQHNVPDPRVIATEACRRAVNGRSFVRRAARETGLSIDIITAEDEARLAVAGCAPLIDPKAEQLLVFDIGGGSTELIWIDMSHTPPSRRQRLIRAMAPPPSDRDDPTARAAAAHIRDWISVPMGVSTLSDRFSGIAGDTERFVKMSAAFAESLSSFAPTMAAGGMDWTRKLQIIGVSGTATTFGAMHLGLRSYDRSMVDGLWLDVLHASQISQKLIDLGRDGRARDPGVGAGRANLVLPGAAILMTILNLWPVARMRIADRGLREGMLYGLIEQRRDDLEAADDGFAP